MKNTLKFFFSRNDISCKYLTFSKFLKNVHLISLIDPLLENIG